MLHIKPSYHGNEEQVKKSKAIREEISTVRISQHTRQIVILNLIIRFAKSKITNVHLTHEKHGATANLRVSIWAIQR